jgi:hypothetical protein
MRFFCSRVRGKERAVGSIQGFLKPEKDAAISLGLEIE